MASEHPNFYLLLELDPAVDDWPAIELQLRAKREQWAKDRTQGNPKAKRRAEGVLPLLPLIEETLKDPAKRREQAQRARQEQAAARSRDLADLDEVITLLKSSGECDAEQWKKLRQQFDGRLDEGTLRSRLEAAGIRLEFEERTGREREPPAPALDKTLAAMLQKNLDHLELASLYDFLGLRSQSSPKALLDRAGQIYAESMKRGRADANSAAVNELVGACKKIFASEPDKAKYDRYLALSVLDALKPRLEVAGADGVLSQDEVDVLIQQARQRGVAKADAECFIADYAATRRWRISKSQTGPRAPEPQLCGFCSELSPAGAMRCRRCGESLKLACPSCAAVNSTADAACSKCGARIGDAPLVQKLLREGEELSLAGDLAAALVRFDQGLLYWPGWAPLLAAKQRTDDLRQARERAVAEIERLVADRHLMAAQVALDRFDRTQGKSGLDGIRDRVCSGLGKARTAFESAEALRRAHSDPDAVLAGYEEALSFCADFEPALKAAAANPPPPPVGLRVEPAQPGFLLRWSEPKARRKFRYRIVRKARSTPQGPDDGEKVGELSATELTDAAAGTGVPWFYAVFTLRGSTASQEAARSGPHLQLAEVENLQVIAGNSQIQLRWSPPPGSLRVEVRRARGEIPGQDGGVLVAPSGTMALATGLLNDEVYGFRVCAIYPDPGRAGGELRTPGRTATAKPTAPPRPVDDLRAAVEDGMIHLSWTPPPGTRVEILRSSSSLSLASGSVVSVADLGSLGELVPNLANGSAHNAVGKPGRVFFQAFSIRDQTAVAGQPVGITTLEPFRDLKARRTGGGLALTWKWPNGVLKGVVTWDSSTYPEGPLPGSSRHRVVTRAEYDHQGCWVLPKHDATGRTYFAVFAQGEVGDTFAPPARVVESGGEQTTVEYQVVVRKNLLTRRVTEAWIELSTPDPLSKLPALVIVGKATDVPISPTDGEILAKTDQLPLVTGKARIGIPARFLTSNYFLKLYFQDPGSSQEIRLMPAARQRLRLA